MSTDLNDEVVIVCGPVSYFLDDIETKCTGCGSKIFYRPHAPKGIHVCLVCAVKQAIIDPQSIRDVKVTEETIKEVQEEIERRKKRH